MVWLVLLPTLALGSFFDSVVSNLLGFHEGEACNYTRVDSLLCLIEHVDTNHNGQIEEREFEYAKNHYLPRTTKDVLWIANKFGFNIKFHQLLRDCDPDRNGILTPWDWMHSQHTCLPTQSEMCKLKTICARANKK